MLPRECWRQPWEPGEAQAALGEEMHAPEGADGADQQGLQLWQG